MTDTPAQAGRERVAGLDAALAGVVSECHDRLPDRLNFQMGADRAPVPPELLDVRAVADLVGASPRHVYRMADAGRMPAPVKLGALVRWPRRALLDWIAAGCPNVRTAAKGARR